MIFKTSDVPHIIEVEIDGEITEDEMGELEERFNQKKNKHGKNNKLNLLVEVTHINYTLEGLIKEIGFDKKHLDDMEKIAVVSNDKWVKYAEKINQYLPNVAIDFFDTSEKEKAMTWLS
ncbi:MAG: STAS/SEC14 domain-containing protein [Alkalibacterium sp.]|nr:STAS/SEC14 domain-containing protein [Alkalibacterium sp.]